MFLSRISFWSPKVKTPGCYESLGVIFSSLKEPFTLCKYGDNTTALTVLPEPISFPTVPLLSFLWLEGTLLSSQSVSPSTLYYTSVESLSLYFVFPVPY